MEPIEEIEEEYLKLDDVLDEDEMEQYEQLREQEKAAYILKSMAVVEEQEKLRKESKETKFMQEQEEFNEGFSKIALRSGRLITRDELNQVTEGKQYVDIDSLDKVLTPESARLSSNFFTIGILCMTSKIKMSKAKISFLTWVFTSLKRVEIKPSDVSSMRIKHGYKTLAVFIYGEAAQSFVGTGTGGVYAILSPIPMPKSTEHEFALRITHKEQILKIGNSLDFDYCIQKSKVNGAQCHNFINAATERYCDLHVHKKADLIKAKRPMLQSTYLDLNQVKKDKAEEQLLVGIPFKKGMQRKSAESEMTKETKEKYGKWQADEASKLAAFMKKRSEPRTQGNQLHKMLAGAARFKSNVKTEEVKPGETKPATQPPKAGEEVEFELEVEEEVSKEDDEFIKKILAKKKQTFGEKFIEGTTEQDSKRSNTANNTSKN